MHAHTQKRGRGGVFKLTSVHRFRIRFVPGTRNRVDGQARNSLPFDTRRKLIQVELSRR